MTTPFEYCVICDGYGGNGAPCGGCKNDSGSPLRVVDEIKKPEILTWAEFTAAVGLHNISLQELIDYADSCELRPPCASCAKEHCPFVEFKLPNAIFRGCEKCARVEYRKIGI